MMGDQFDEKVFGNHAKFQVTEGVSRKAMTALIKGDYETVRKTAIQYAFNLGVSAMYYQLSKQEGYDLLDNLKRILANPTTKETFRDSAIELCDEIARISIILAKKL